MDYWRGRPNDKHICMYFCKETLPSLWPMWVFSCVSEGKAKYELQVYSDVCYYWPYSNVSLNVLALLKCVTFLKNYSLQGF